MPYHVHERLTHAAEKLGATLNQFVVQSGVGHKMGHYTGTEYMLLSTTCNY